ncbi:S8 family serine peptidase [uncultured Lactobacillus sp.]|uniref:S8 family serine peptidase n=1 Tax=uncultured Lactobacillus sp. TaxID=153152 RepID=UPI00262F62D7|nr:S8 family serine peptidase [uncultured Lactobacillus sp.]
MKKKSRKYASLLLSVAVLASAQVFPSLEQQVKATIDSQTSKSKTAASKSALANTTTGLTSKAIEAQLAANGVKFEQLTPQEQKDVYVEVIVQLSASPASENGSINPQTASTAEIEQATNRVIDSQQSIKNQVQAITNQAIGKSYGYVVNGFSTKVKVKDIQKLRKIPGVKSVTLAKVYFATDASADNMANVSTVWSNYKYKGQGTVVSIIDTGIDPNHKDLRLSDESKVKLTAKDVNDFTKNSGYGRYFTSKVPFGHNYSDNNDIITDDGKEQHGMHVAGIVAANGTGKDPAKSVVGVAPEAQLLAMKAFSNSDSSSTTDSTSVIGAIDDSAKLGADVLNMSLGSVSGQQTEDDPEIAAVEKAVKSGTSAVISAGNSGTSTSDKEGNNKDYFGNPDMETVGSPGTSRSATTVASAENVNVTTSGITISADGKTLLGPEVTQVSDGTDLSAFNNKNFYLVKDKSGKLGVGTSDQYTSDVKGKIAVVARGQIAFTDKQTNAQAAGASGLIIVNNAGGNAPLSGVLYNAGFPTVGLSTEAGNKLVEYIEKHPEQALQVSIAVQPLNNVAREKDLMSDFTSYGPASNLAFKPDITAPGGNIWSLQNNNSYVNMSGTSMASPFIAGSQALLIQAMNDKSNKFYDLYQKMSAVERTTFIKTLEMNTATIVPDVTHDSVIESPRRQGAGLVNVEAAINALHNNPSTVSAGNDYPGVELRDFTDSKHQFTLKFTNRTNKALTYTLQENGKFADVYTSAKDDSSTLYEKKIEGASVETNGKIVVPANSTKQVSLTLNLPENFAANQYVEGFLTFKASDSSTLSIPYMGFYGDWGQPQIFDKLNGVTFDPANNNLGTIVTAGNDKKSQGIAGLTKDENGNYQIDEDALAFSTDPNASVTWLKPQYFLFRNAKNVKAQILDKDGHVINTLATLNNVTKSYWYANGQRYSKFSYAPAWDGTYFNQQTNKTETVVDGKYVYRIEGTVDGTQTVQHYDINMIVDSKAPEVKTPKLISKKDASGKKRQYFIKVEAKDELSGLDGSANTAVNGVVANGVSYNKVSETKDGFSVLEIPLSDSQVAKLGAGRNSISLAVFDNATNAGTNSGYSQKPGATEFGLVFTNGGLTGKITSRTKGYDSVDGVYQMAGNYPGDLYATYTDSQGKEHDLPVKRDEETGDFTALLPVQEADYTTTIKFYSDDSKDDDSLVASKQIKVSVLAAKVESLSVDGEQTYTASDEKDPQLAQTSEDTVTVSGKTSEDASSVTVKAGGKTIKATLNADHTFSADVPVEFGENEIEVIVADKDGNKSSVKQVVKSSNRGQTTVSSSDVTFDDGVKFGTMSVNDKTANYDAKDGVLTLTGKVKRPTTTLNIGGKNVQVKADGSFTIKLDLGKHGSKVFPVLIGDTTVAQVVQERLTFYVDANHPSLTLDAEKLEDGSYKPIYTNKDKYTISGEFADDYAYYNLNVNGNNVAASYADVDYNSNKDFKKKFECEVDLKEGKNTFNVEGTDDNDNSTGVQTLVVYYKKAQELAAPAVTATVANDNKSVNLTASTNEEDAHVVYSLDNKTFQDLGQKGLTVKENGKVYFKTVDKYGNESKVTTYDVTQVKQTTDSDDNAKELAQAKKDLRNKLNEARELGKSGKYTHESAQVLAQARQKAAEVLRNKDASLKDVQNALQTLEDAIKALAQKPQSEKPNKDQDDKAKQEQALKQAKDALRQQAQKASQLDVSKFTPDSVQNLSKAIAVVNTVLDNANASLTDVEQASKQLSQAQQSLVEKPALDPSVVQAKDALKAKVAEVEKLDLSKYTDDSQKVLNSVLDLAKSVLADDQATADVVQKVSDALDAAKKALSEKAVVPTPPVQDPNLVKAKEDLKLEVEKDKKLDLSKYTDESKAALAKALKAASEILANEKAQLTDLQNAKKVLVAAREGLSEKQAQPVLPPVHQGNADDGSKDQKPNKPVNPTNPPKDDSNKPSKPDKQPNDPSKPTDSNKPNNNNKPSKPENSKPNTSTGSNESNTNLDTPKSNSGVTASRDDGKEILMNAVGFAPVIHNNPNWKIALRDQNGHLTGKYISTNTSWRIFAKKEVNGKLYYRLGSQAQWVPADFLKLSQNSDAKKLNKVVYVPVLHNNKNYKVALWNSKGKLTGYIKTNTRWKVFEQKTINGRLMYRIGNDNQWVQAQYAKLV